MLDRLSNALKRQANGWLFVLVRERLSRIAATNNSFGDEIAPYLE
jgi:hypothetical protein